MKSNILPKLVKDVLAIGQNLNGALVYLAYIRVSTKAQAEVQHGSPEQQRHAIVRWAQRHASEIGYLIQLHMIEEEVSGTEEALSKRPGFQGILQAIEKQSIDGVIAEKLDRFGRGNYLHDFVKLAERNNVKIIEVDSGEINLRDKNSRMSFTVKTMVATEYSLDLKEKIPKKQRSALLNNGKDRQTVPCLGLDPHPTKTGMYLNNAKEAKQVLDIAHKCIEFGGVGYQLIDHCSQKGYRTKLRRTIEKIDKEGTRIPSKQLGGKPFDAESLRRLLTNPKVRGTGRFKDTWNQFPEQQDNCGFVEFNYAHEPVVPHEVFDKVQAVLHSKSEQNGRTGRNRRIYLLSGVFKTADGRPFQGVPANSGQNLYYQTADREILIQVEKIENLVLERVKQYIHQSEVVQSVLKTTLKHRLSGLPLIDSEIQDEKSKVLHLNKAIEGFSSALREAAINKSSDILETTRLLISERDKTNFELQESQARLITLQKKREYISEHFREKTIQEYLKRIMIEFDKRPREEQKRIIQSIIPSLVYYPAENRIELSIIPVTESADLPSFRHAGGKNLRVLEKWRVRL